MLDEKNINWHQYEIPFFASSRRTLALSGKTKIPIETSCPVRNWKAVFMHFSDSDVCECGTTLQTKTVSFSVWAIGWSGGFGHVEHLKIAWCPKCDKEPKENEILRSPLELAGELH